MAVFAYTPGISQLWRYQNLALYRQRYANLLELVPNAKELGRENIKTATYDDAVRYVARGLKGSHFPEWAIPFYLEDIKLGMPQSQLLKTWGNKSRVRQKDFLKGVQDVFHTL